MENDDRYGESGLSTEALGGFLAVHAVFLVLLDVFAWRDLGTPGRLLAVGLTAIVLAAVAFRFRLDARCGTREDHLLAVGLVLVWLALVGAVPDVFFMHLFTLYPAVYLLVPVRSGLVITFVLAVRTVIPEIDDDEPEAVIFFLSVFGWIGGAILALWIQEVYRRASEWMTLHQELERTRAELADAERAAGAATERQRMAREIHDTLAQGFTSIVLHADEARRGLGASDARDAIDRIEAVARENLESARRLMAAEAPADLERGLEEALRRLVSRVDTNGAEVGLDVEGTATGVDPARAVVLYRAAQEALANALKHADARNIRVTLSEIGDTLTLDVADDGRGFAASDPPRAVAGTVSGRGLAGLRERLDEVDGRLAIESQPGGGTVVSVAVPR